MTQIAFSARSSIGGRVWNSVIPALVALSAAACGSSDPKKTPAEPGAGAPSDVIADLKIIPTPRGGAAFYTPVLTIKPGEDKTYCTYMDTVTDKDLLVHTTKGSQSKFGHHSLIFYTTAPEKPRTEECYGEGMENLHQMLGGGGGEGTAFYDPPANVSSKVPKGSQIVVQSHWINSGIEDAKVQAMMVTEPGEDGPDSVLAGSVAIVNTTFQIPPQGHYETVTACTFDRPHRLIMSLGHEHEWGTHVYADVTHADGATEKLLDRAFSPHDVFDPPVDTYSLSQPLEFAAGDKLEMTCQWENSTTDSIVFPREMCVFFGYTLEPEDAHCVDGEWTHDGVVAGDAGAGPTGPSCIPPGSLGNELKVGEYCTPKGGECTDNGSGNATLCAADFGGPGFCMKPCIDAAACGTGAVCIGDSPTSAAKGCVPDICAPSWALPDGGAPTSP